MFEDIEARVAERSECEQRNDTPLVINHPILNQLYKEYTKYAFELMLGQYMKAHEFTIKP
jgi:hypothetical protein